MLEDGLVKIFKTLSISSDPSSVLDNQHTSCSSALHASLENPLYGMANNFTLSQAPPAISTLPPQPKKAIVVNPPMVETLIASLVRLLWAQLMN
jgi:hypothetical protein